MKQNKSIIDYRSQEQSISNFRTAIEDAKKLLLPLDEYGDTQRRVIISTALLGLDKADIPYYSRAMNVLMGQRDKSHTTKGELVIKKMKRGQIRHRNKDKMVIVPVERI